MEQKKVRTYLLYAVGEIALVMIGILLALQVNNWNQERLIQKERQDLIQNLISEMNTTIERMDESIIRIDQYLKNGFILMNLLPDGGKGVSIDSLKRLMNTADGIAIVEPQLTTYNQAVSSGKIALIKNQNVLKYFTEMLIHQKRYERHILIGADHYYLGPNWEIKKELGDLRQLYPFGYSNRLPPISDEYKMTDSEYRDFIRKPIVYAISQNMWQIQSNLRNSFYGMRSSALLIKEELEQMQLDQ